MIYVVYYPELQQKMENFTCSPVFDVIFSSSRHKVAAELIWKLRSRIFWKCGDVGTRSI